MKTPAPSRRTSLTPRQRLEQQPDRFSLDRAVAVLAPGVDPADVAFRCSARLGAPAGEVEQVWLREGALATPTMGLIGPGGVLPRHYTALVDDQMSKRSPALRNFIDVLSRRFTGLYVKAGAKHRPSRNPQLAETVLAASVGLATPHLVDRLSLPLAAILYHAGGLATRTRSAERLRGMLAEETGAVIDIEEFAGGWIALPSSEQSRLPARGGEGQYHRLGVDTALGSLARDAAARFLIRLGPLSWRAFQELLPGSPLHRRLATLTRLHVGLEQQFAFVPVLRSGQVPPLRLARGNQRDGDASGRLGWTSWLNLPVARQRDASDAVLGADPPTRAQASTENPSA